MDDKPFEFLSRKNTATLLLYCVAWL